MTKTQAAVPILRNLLLALTLLPAWSCQLRPSPPFPEPDRLVVLRETDAAGESLGVSPDNLLAWRDSSPGFESVSAHSLTEMELQGDEPRKVRAVRCTVDFFETLGVSPVLGRTFVAGDLERNVAVLSYELWLDRFAGKPDVIGGEIHLDDRDHIVLGILPEGTRYPDMADLWVLLQPSAAQDEHVLTVTARLSSGVTPEQAKIRLNEVDLPCGHGAGVVAFSDARSSDSG